MARIYSTTGDDGSTGLIGGKRVPKDDPRIEACGSIDELNAVLGVVSSFPLPDKVAKMLGGVQDTLFSIGAGIALPPGQERGEWGIPAIADEHVKELELHIDSCQEALPPLRHFILPGGNQAGAMLHLARTVARRAERRCVTLSRIEPVDLQVIRYLNRLSDLCFVLARYVNREDSRQETHPTFGRR
jgi:cob(I)alamin adenosyltransferase